MAQYSGNLLSTGIVAANYRRAIAPFSNFGSRQMAFMVVSFPSNSVNTNTTEASVSTADTTNVGGTGEDYQIKDTRGNVVVPASNIFASNSAIYSALNGIAIAAEIFLVGQPAFSGTPGSNQTALMTVGIFIDTAASAYAGQSIAGEQNGQDANSVAVGNTAAQTIQTAVVAATGISGITVRPAYISGNSLTVGSVAY
jgi:hypothetical protein